MRLVLGRDLKPFECAHRVEINSELWNYIMSGETFWNFGIWSLLMKTNRRTLSNENHGKKNVHCPERCKHVVQWEHTQTASHRHAWDRRRRHDRACEAKHKSQLSIKQHNKNDERLMHNWPSDKDPRWLVLDLECRSRNTRPPALCNKLASALKAKK